MRVLLPILAAIATPAAAQVRVVPQAPASESAARSGVDVFLINEGDGEQPAQAPQRIEVTAENGDRLALVPAEPGPATIAAKGFARVRYRFAGVVEAAQAAPPPAPATVPPTANPPVVTAALPPPAPAEGPVGKETIVTSANGTSSGFLDRFSPYEPIYGVIGAGDAGAKLQVSFALRPFGGSGLLSHFKFAYTQTLFWALNEQSGPMRTSTYSPEAFFDLPIAHDLSASIGYRHDSNGKDIGSIDVNRVRLRVAKGFDLGDGWRAELVPEAWVLFGSTPDLDRYWGYTALKASIEQADGVKLSVTARGNPGTGKGAAELFASYPLAGIGKGIGLYVFGQGFTGYGESLDDFRKRQTYARLGIALTR